MRKDTDPATISYVAFRLDCTGRTRRRHPYMAEILGPLQTLFIRNRRLSQQHEGWASRFG
jgi:hypothetical protein